MISSQGSFEYYIREILMAPINDPGLLPNVAPLLLSLVVMELYFGKHKRESLGWNTSVGNSIIWVATGLVLIFGNSITSTFEYYATLGLIGTGLFIGYMNFFHKWSEGVAFALSSTTIINTLAYILVVLVKTDLPVNTESIQASGAILAGTFLFFRTVRMIEKPANDGFSGFNRSSL